MHPITISASVVAVLALQLIALHAPHGMSRAEETPKARRATAQKEPMDTSAETPPAEMPIKISRETTYITEPIAADGWPDYTAALNALARKGVTRDNNAALILRQAWGPVEYDGDNYEEVPEALYEQLEMKRPPARGDYFVPFEYFKEQRLDAVRDSRERELLEQRYDDEYSLAQEAPWRADELDAVAAWLRRIKGPLDLIVKGTARSRNYIPMIAGGNDDPELLNSESPFLYTNRDCVRALICRGMLRAGAVETDKATEDLIAALRLGLLTGDGPTLIHGLNCSRSEAAALRALGTLVRDTPLTTSQARKIEEGVKGLPKRQRSMVYLVNTAERFMALDAASAMARDEARRAVGLKGNTRADDREHKIRIAIGRRLVYVLADWNQALREINGHYDRLVAASHRQDTKTRNARFKQILADLEKIPGVDAGRVNRRERLIRDNMSPEQAARAISASICLVVTPNLEAFLNNETETKACLEMLLLACAATQYRADHDHLPKQLSELVPKYVKQLPRDPFGRGTFGYRVVDGRMLIYSVGPNGRDEKGRYRTDEGVGDLPLVLPTYEEQLQRE